MRTLRTKHCVMLLLSIAVGCHQQPSDLRVAAASSLTARCAHVRRLAPWNIHAEAAGRDCRVLLIQTSIEMEDSMVESLHYGAAAYVVSEGGVRQYSRQSAFRGVVYRDTKGGIWTYDVDSDEAKGLTPCK